MGFSVYAQPHPTHAMCSIAYIAYKYMYMIMITMAYDILYNSIQDHTSIMYAKKIKKDSYGTITVLLWQDGLSRF